MAKGKQKKGKGSALESLKRIMEMNRANKARWRQVERLQKELRLAKADFETAVDRMAEMVNDMDEQWFGDTLFAQRPGQ